MIKSREPAIERISVIFQVFITLVCFYFTLWISQIITFENFKQCKECLVILFIMAPIWFVLLELFELGRMARIQRYRHLLKKYFFVISIGSILLYLVASLFENNFISPIITLKFALINYIVLSFQKITSRSILKYFRNKGFNSRLILIIADESTIPFINQITDTKEWGYIIRGIVTDSDEIKNKFGSMYPIFSETDDFAHLIDDKIIDEVFFCKQNFNTKTIEKEIQLCREVGVIFHIHNNVLCFNGVKPNLTYINHQFLLSFRNTPGNYFALKIKGTIDFFFTIIILILSAPLMLTIAILIKLEDGGPVLFKQVRVGRHGRLFKCLKFRTMVTNAEELREKLMELNEQDGPVFKIKNDPRITKVGKFLRKTSLDELPQFFNVLFGDMSIVGPRPPIPSEVAQYKRCLTRRLSINPGITCIWQVSGRNNVPFEKWMEMDMEYIDNWSLMLDFVIILKTFKVIISSNGQ